MFRFAHPIYLYLLALLPLLVSAYILIRHSQQQRLKKFGNPDLVRALMPGVSQGRRTMKFAILMVALGLLIIIIARPQFTEVSSEDIESTGIEVMVAVDVSNSMLCQDVSPDRLTKAKMTVSKLTEQFDTDRLGLVAFAGSAITLLPMTADYVSAKMFLDQISPATVTMQGTNLGEAIRRATAGFSTNDDVGKALILITDAEDNEEGALDAARETADQGVRIFVLAVGTKQGGPIPQDGGYKKASDGTQIITHLNEEVGISIAKAADGFYMNVDNTDAAQRKLRSEIETMQKKSFTTSQTADYDEQFVAVAILLLVLLILEVCIMEKKNPLLRRFRFLPMLLPLLLISCKEETDRDYVRQGNRAYASEVYEESTVDYQKAVGIRKSFEAFYNMSHSYIQQEMDDSAYNKLDSALQLTTGEKKQYASAYHNQGNLMYAQAVGQMRHQRPDSACIWLRHAIEKYKSALRNNSYDNRARYNLAMAQYWLKKNEEEASKQNENENDKQDKQQKKDKNANKNANDKQDKREQSGQKQQTQAGQIDPQTVEQLLNSAQQDEKKVQERVGQLMKNANKRKLEKDW